MKLQKRLLGATALLGLIAGPAVAQDSGILKEEKVTVSDLAELNASFPQAGKRQDRVQDYLRTKGAIDPSSALELVSERRSKSGRIHQRFEQKIDGRRVYGSTVIANFAKNGDLEKLQHRTRGVGMFKVRKAQIDAQEALEAARQRVFPNAPTLTGGTSEGFVTTFASDPFFYEAPSVEEVVVTGKGRNSVGFLVKLWSGDSNELYHVLVGPNGQVLDVEDRTARDQYGVFADHPGNSAQTIVQGPGAGNAESPAGWLFSGTQYANYIRGNNVSAYLDRNNNNAPDTASAPIADGSFIYAADLGADPATTQNQRVAIQNLFYLNNRIHDILYAAGFDEAAGNFQEDNFGRGGAGSDSVNAEAQDGGGVNNANFATPSDGYNPRMQMYLWNLTSPYRDGDLDSDIVYHEYGHGLTWRMIGSMSGSVSGAIGEGMGDVLALLINDDDRVGEYSTNDPAGIRSARYTNYNRTLGDRTGTSVHYDGEIYAGAIWRLKEIFNANGLSNYDLLDTLVEGMNFTAPGPDYIDMRNGILDAAPSSQDCFVWQAFADFGMGSGATMSSESFALPSTCGGGGGGSADTTPPDFSNLRAQRLSGGRFRLTWNSDEPSTSQVRFPAYSYTYTDSTLKTSHSVTFQGSVGTTYQFYIEGSDAAGNLGSEGPYSYRR
ncbi:M36 family metallopeptidase [Parvularcula lutaonensis]|uniref:M36 family metallopeptidase n=1 Tax=Parvularcula lutaonensis TaxID=491923 RepID=A0ABV7MD20_9PROT|nr:M36 family metallopeptidase [Parvularcula lutaonensis]GGY52182.1 hypothetical protein GCM10007148_21580 [Parvularcula lutaonensis]